MSLFGFSTTKVRSWLEPSPNSTTYTSNRRNSDSTRAIESDPDMPMVGSYTNGPSIRAQMVTRSSSVAVSPLPQQIREQQESRHRENHRTHKDSQIKGNRSSSKATPTMPAPSNYKSTVTAGQTSSPSRVNSPAIPAASPPSQISDAKRSQGANSKAGNGTGEAMTDWETVSQNKASTTEAKDTKSRGVDEARSQRPEIGQSKDDEYVAWKVEKRRMARDLEALVQDKAHLLTNNEQLKQKLAESEEKAAYINQDLVENKQVNEALTVQVTSLKQAHAQMAEHARVAEGQVREVERYCNELHLGYQKLDSEVVTLRAKAREVEERGGRLDQLRKAEEQVRVYEQYCRDLQEKNQRLEAEARTLKDKTREAEEREGHLQALLDVRTSDLKGAKTFLTMEDKFSGADVLKMVDALNAEIFQASAYLAGLIEDVPKEEMRRLKWSQCMSEDAYKTIQRRVGPELMAFIEEKGPDNRRDPLALQLAFQALLSWWSVYMVNTFADGNTGVEIGLLYKYIRETEPQAVSARWRAITSEKMGKFMKPTFTNFITYSIAGVLKMGGASFSRGGKHSTAIEDSIAVIERVWKQIKAAAKEGIISCDVDLAHTNPGAAFDPATMEDSYQEDGMYSPQDLVGVTVLCPVAVGLKRSYAKRLDDGQSKLQDEILLKPKVVLSTVFNHIGDFSVATVDDNMLRELRDGK